MKESLALPHRGADGMPRKVVWMPLGKSESWYSLVLDIETQDLPSLVDLRKISTLTGNSEPLRVLARWWGEGHDLAEPAPCRLLTKAIEVDGLLTGQLAAALEDGIVSRQEAKELLEAAGTRLCNAQQVFDVLKRLAAGRN